MTQTPVSGSSARRMLPPWAQVSIWLFLLGILVLLAASLFKAQVPMIQVGQTVPDFTVPLYAGYEYNGSEVIRFSDLDGKVVLVNFWASWCVPCEDEAELMEEAWQLYQPGGEVIFLGIDYVDTPSKGLEYLETYSISYPNGPDIRESISSIFNREMGVPETFIIDRHGVLQVIQIGPFTSLGQIQAILDALLAEE